MKSFTYNLKIADSFIENLKVVQELVQNVDENSGEYAKGLTTCDSLVPIKFSFNGNDYKVKTSWKNIINKFLGIDEKTEKYFNKVAMQSKFIKIVHTISSPTMQEFVKKNFDLDFVNYQQDVYPILLGYDDIVYNMAKKNDLFSLLMQFLDVKNFKPDKVTVIDNGNYPFSFQQFLALFYLVSNGYRPILVTTTRVYAFMNLLNPSKYVTDVFIAVKKFESFYELIAFL